MGGKRRREKRRGAGMDRSYAVILSEVKNPGTISTNRRIKLMAPNPSAHFPEPEEDCAPGAAAGAASFINIGHRGNAKFPATSSITFTWHT